jgi:NitT/TauT family transport system ATP-binding protein
LFDADGTKRMQSRYPLLSMEGARIEGGSHDKRNLAVEDVRFEVWAGEKVMLLGPSGCGKSTLLKAIAGFIKPDSGVISFAGILVEATFRLLESCTVIRWGMKVGRE